MYGNCERNGLGEEAGEGSQEEDVPPTDTTGEVGKEAHFPDGVWEGGAGGREALTHLMCIPWSWPRI